MVKLSDLAAGRWGHSQFGEEGQIAEIFNRIGIESQVCVEFGAADGLKASNTAALWKNGWRAVLIEADLQYRHALLSNVAGFNVTPITASVTPHGSTSIDMLLDTLEVDDVDLMSIDVDGDDYAIWEAMETRPRVVCIEYNQSIPPHVSLRQAETGDCFGASALALCSLAESKGYSLVGLTRCNLLFVDEPEAGRFSDLERNLDVLFDPSGLTYWVSDCAARGALVGTPPWGWSSEPYLGDVEGAELRRTPLTPTALFEAYDRLYGPGEFVSRWRCNVADLRPEAKAQGRLALIIGQEGAYLEGALGPPLVCIDLRHVSVDQLDSVEWVKPFAEARGYRCRMDPGLLTLIWE